MELVVLGGSGGWPRPEQGCSGYLVEHDGFRLLIDPGYGVLGELLRHCEPAAVDAVLISHGHPDHCADLNPLLRSRVLGANCDRLPVLAPHGAVDAVLALDPLASVAAGADVRPVAAGSVTLGPLAVQAAELRHHVLTLGFRITSDDGAVLAYTADSGDSGDRLELARNAGLLIAEASYPEGVPAEDAPYLSDAAQVARLASDADVDHLLLTHLMPFADPFMALVQSRAAGFDAVEVARPGLRRTVEPRPDATWLPRRAAARVITLTNSRPRRAASGS
ncbi:MBL fold metallo-hydrolase [Microlunatus sp. Gsoil 973]|uniref:MBL fold metallo-hydrolase n=1 Tax=Microlunatus sp. Gsoil 973 TaxID=2672569 RepID=UPI0012B48E73|nr:MBL fold metallo-hydrolase [Microlunatus sp. Gsoil 973]QGN33402.1 MBL fold metallo-hydrolase [Microlunatus sp. Gsoil 973]